MSRIISRAESWERAYQIFNQVNFNAFDFTTIKQSLLDYLKIYFPEDFNDFIESSEFIAFLEIFAYIGELLAYRLDLNAHENFLTTAQRKDSILRLAKLISYSASRNIPSRGLVKLTSIQTSEPLTDSNGLSLTNVKINWDDVNNINWKEQFLLVINRVLQQKFGTVNPSERIQIDDVLFELYRLNNTPLVNGIFGYSANVSGQTVQMELVPVSLDDSGPFERRPDNTSPFSILFGNDGLGDSSDTTGFFMFTKQGTLIKDTTSFDGITPNQIFDVNTANINDIDVWINNIDPDTFATINDGSVSGGVSGEWEEVDVANAQNIIFNTNLRRQKYELETLNNDEVRFVFGDGEFAEIPNGTFDIWYRTSGASDIIIPKNSVLNKNANFSYLDSNGNIQTLTFTFSLVSSLQNASPSETIEHIRRVAPAVYFTQDRMVNNRDYNTFMLQDPSILKLRAVNRTFAGDSKWISWHDPRETYENVRLFGDDGSLYIEPIVHPTINATTSNVNVLIDNFIQPILSTSDFFTAVSINGLPLQRFRAVFDDTFTNVHVPSGERTELVTLLSNMISIGVPNTLRLFFSTTAGNTLGSPLQSPWQYTTNSNPDITFFTDWLFSGGNTGSPLLPGTGIITINLIDGANGIWTIEWLGNKIIFESPEIRFWNTNDGLKTIDYDTLNSVRDKIVLLNANISSNQICNLGGNINFPILSHALTEAQLSDIHRLSILPDDVDNDGISDNLTLTGIINGRFLLNLNNPTANQPNPLLFDLPFPMLFDDLSTGLVNVFDLGSPQTLLILGIHYQLWDDDMILPKTTGEAATRIEFFSTFISLAIDLQDYVYFNKTTLDDPWVIMPLLPANIEAWFTEVSINGTYPNNFNCITSSSPTCDTALWKRLPGRQTLNFAWLHEALRFHLINPAQTNIIDTFIMTRGFFTSLRSWLDGQTTIEPIPPTPLDLRTTYAPLLDNRMISDTIVLHSGLFKVLFGSKAIEGLQAQFKVIKSPESLLTDNQIKSTIVGVIKQFFDISLQEFGETFYVTELISAIHNELPSDIDSVVLVPKSLVNQFGDLFMIEAREDEILAADIGVEDIVIVERFTPLVLRQDL